MKTMEAQAILCLLLLPGILGSPFNWDVSRDQASMKFQTKCSSHCTGSSKFQYQEGKTYRYNYDVSSITNVQGASEDNARLDITADVYIHVLSKCELALTLSDVSVRRSEPNTKAMKDVTTYEYKNALETRSILRFSFQDGKVEDICPSNDEEPFAINFKRGILSAFQNSMNQHDRPENVNEIDVTGNCPTAYSISQRGTKSMQISKSKDLLGCSERNHFRTSLQSMPFHSPNAIKSLPLLRGNHKCTQTISRSNGHVTKSLCLESLIFRPFSKKESGAKTETTQKLDFIEITDQHDIQKDGVFKKSSLVFDHSKSKVEMNQLLWTTKEKMNELCQASANDISSQVPALFADLVYMMRGLDSRDIMDVWERVERGSVCANNHDRALKFILDSLPMVGTSASVEVMTEMLLGKRVVGAEAELWMTSFTFIQHPEAAMIKQLKRLIMSETHRRLSLLPVTSLINNFCKMQTDCLSNSDVVDIIDSLSDILGKNCQSTDKDLMLTTLRAVGNIGHADQLSSALEMCMSLSTNAMITRVMAAQAFRGVTCKAKRDSLMDMFLNKGEDSELRIAAYLSLMQCPTTAILKQVQITLETEPVNQVGSFVWTHLTNLMETFSPQKQALKDILEDEKLKKEYDMDQRKYSRNYEWSYFSDKFGTGAMAESNLIWSSSSFMPRSLMLNLTIDFLGHSVNLIEVGGRTEGLEKLFMNYFGPGGVFEKKDKPEKFNNPSRCVKKSKMNDMNKKHGVDEDEMSASFYLRMFGNDLDFKHFNEKDIMEMKSKLNTKDIIESLAKGDRISFSHSAMFLDTTLSVPTISGMALELSVNGTSSIELKATGKMNLRNLSKKKMEMNFNVRPSGAVQLAGLMTLNAGIIKTGLRMVTTLHSSTAISGSIDLTNGQVLSAVLDTPKDKLEVLDVKSEFFIVHDHEEEKQLMLEDQTVNKKGCSENSLTKALGYVACIDLSYVDSTLDKNAPYFPLTGPMSFSLVIIKKDAPRGFKLLGKYIMTDESFSGHGSFSTPGSEEDRNLAIGYYIDTKDKSMEMELTSPWKKLLLKGAYVVNDKTRSMLATFMNDGRETTLEIKTVKHKQTAKTIWIPSIRLVRPVDSPLAKIVKRLPEKFSLDGQVAIGDSLEEVTAEFNISSGVKPDPIRIQATYMNKKTQKAMSASVTVNNKKTWGATFQAMTSYSVKKSSPIKIQPTILLTAPGRRVFVLSGIIDYKENKMLRTDLLVNMDKLLKRPIKLNMKIVNKKDSSFAGNGKLTSQFIVLKSKGVVVTKLNPIQKDSTILKSKITTSYVLPTLRIKNYVVMNLKVNDRSTSSIKNYFTTMNVYSKNYADASFHATLDVSQKPSFMKSMLTIIPGPKVKKEDKSKEIKIGATITHKLTDQTADIRYDLQATYPIKKIDYQWKGKHEHTLTKQFSFETYNMIVLSKGKTIELRLKGDDVSKDLLEAYGNMELNYPSFNIGGKKIDSQDYKLTTIIQQTQEKEYIHTVNVRTKEGHKHVMVTNFKKMKDNDFNFKSEVDINGEHKSKVILMALNDEAKTKALVSFKKDNKIYKGDFASEIVDEKNWKIDTDINYPEQRIKTGLEHTEKRGKNKMNVICYWDADKDPSKKIEISTYYKIDMNNNVENVDFEYGFRVTTPFEKHTIYQLHALNKVNPRKLQKEYAFVYGTQDNGLVYKYSINLPITLERFEMMLEMKTPFEKLRNFLAKIQHKFDGSKYLSSIVIGEYNEHAISATVKISNEGDMVRNELKSSLKITSTFPEYKNLKLELSHTDDGRAYNSIVIYGINGKTHKVNLESNYLRIHWSMKLNSHLEINLPDGRYVTIDLSHDNSLTDVHFTITGKWWDRNQAKIILASKFNKAEKDYAIDFSYTSTLKKFHGLILKSNYNEMLGKKGSFFSQVNNDPQTIHSYKYEYTVSEVKFEGANAETKFSGVVKYDRYPYTLFMKNTLTGENAGDYVLDASVDKSHNGWTSDVQLLTPFDEARNIDMKGHLKKIDNIWKLDGRASLDVKKIIKVDFSIDAKDWTTLNCQIISPYEKMTLMKFGFLRAHGKNDYNSTIFMEIQPLFNMVKMNNYISHKPNFNTQFSLDLPDLDFKYIKIVANNVEERRGVKTNVNIKYHPNKEIDLKLKSKFNKNKFPEKTKVILDFSSPFEILKSLSFKTDINKLDGKWISNLNMKTSNANFKSLDAHYELATSDTAFQSDLEIKYPSFEPIVSGIHLDWGDTAGATVTLVAPEIGRTTMGFKRKSASWLDFQNKIFGEYNGHELDMDIGLKHDELSSKIWLTFMYPGATESFIKSVIYREGNSFKDFDVGSFLQIGKNSPEFNSSVQFSFIDNKKSLGFTFITPETMPFSYLYTSLVEGNERKNVGYIMVGKDYLFDFSERAKAMDYFIEYDYKLNYLFDGKGHDVSELLVIKWSSEGGELTLNQHFDGKHIQLEGAYNNAKANRNGKETLDIMLYTPYEHVNDVGLHASLYMKKNNYIGKCTLEYMDDKEAELTFELKEETSKRLSFDATLTIPETEFKKNTLKYTQMRKKEKFTGVGNLVLGNGAQASYNIEVQNGEEFLITVAGPIEEFEKLTVSGKYNANQQRLNGDMQLKLKLHPKPANLEFGIHINNEPVKLNFKLKTPFKNFKNAELTISHTGKEWKQFNTVSMLTSEAIGQVNSNINFNYVSNVECEGKVTLTSSVKNMENLKFGFTTKKEQEKQVSRIEAGWELDKEMTMESSWGLAINKRNTAFEADFEITTPFDKVKSVVFKSLHNTKKTNVNHYIKIAHNGRTHAEGILKYKSGKKHSVNIDIDHPRPMSFDLIVEEGNQKFDGNLKVNWDKHSPENVFEFDTKIIDRSLDDSLDKSFTFKVIHPVRLMGLDCQIKSADKEFLSSGHVTWDERNGKTLTYDMGFSDRSTKYSEMYDAHVKLGVPQRSVKIEGSQRDKGSSKTVTSSIYWDADKDETKKVVLSTTTERQDRTERVSVNLNLPTINKQMNMGITRKLGYGSSILESEAEISYSSDPRKNIIITTKVENTEMDMNDVGNYNYTIDIGFVHRHTGIDLQWESHIGHVNEISSTGSSFTYVTANDDSKVLAFWSQFDSKRNKGKMMIMTPLKTVTLIGDINENKISKSMKFQALEDGDEALKLEVIVDPRRRNIDMEIFYDRGNANKMLTISGNYVNDSAIEVNIISQNGQQTISESQIYLTLNTSQILHTRIVWRPSLATEIQTFLSTQAAVMSHTASETFSQTLKSIGSEVTNKYARVSQELRDEMKQVFELMEKEMDGFSTQLESLRTSYRRFYQSNNLRIREMGEKANAMFDEISTTIQNLVKQYRTYYTRIIAATNKSLTDLRTYPIMQKYLAASKIFVETMKKSRVIIEQAFEDLSEEFQEFSAVTYKIYSRIQRDMNRKLNSYSRLVHELPMYKKMMSQRKFLTDSVQIPEWLKSYERIYIAFQEMLQDQFSDFMARKEFQQLYSIGAEVHSQFMYYNLEQDIESALMRMVTLSKHLVLMEMIKMKDEFMSMDKSRLIVYDPENGELQFELHLPLEMKSLTEPPKFKLEAISKIRSLIVNKLKMPKLPANFSIWDSYYKYVPSLRPSEWLPPFKANGYVIGSQHMLTFDKTHYDFLSSCSHVLARDMLHDSFSVVLNYNKNNQQRQISSLCFHFEDSHSLEISNDYELTVNNKETEMPYYSDIVSVIRDGDLIVVKYTGGVMVVMNPRLDVYKVTLSGWYHGSTAGLLGVFDNEMTNDEGLLDIVRDFEVNRRTCKSTNNLALAPNPDNDIENLCAKLFEDNSSKFRPCFKQVDPSDFLNMCQTYMGSMTAEDAVHKATEQYRFVCRDQGVFMGPLEDYVPCNKEKPIMVEGNDPLYQSADILFMMQDNKCNKWASSSVGSIVTEINKNLNAAGDMKNSRFGLLGIEGMNPTIRTINGHHFGPASHFLKAVETLKFTNEDNPIDLAAATSMALKYPFRTGVAKVLIISTCSGCEVGLLEGNLDAILKDQGIIVHILKQHSSPSIDDDSEDQYFNSKISSEVSSSMSPNTDYCDSLASTTNGFVFDILQLKQGDHRGQRKAIQDIGEKIGWNTKLPACQKCKCNSETGINECQRCETNPILSYIPIKTPSLSEVMGTFHDIEYNVMPLISK